MTEICTIPELKILISQDQERIKEYEIALRQRKESLSSLQKRLDNYVVDGLRMKVREFIAGASVPAVLKRHKLEAPKMPPGVICSFVLRDNPYLDGGASQIDLTEEEALVLSHQRKEYNIDCSVWDTYRYPGEID